MTVPSFESFIAIDWSGAARNYNGIAVAGCEVGRGAPGLVDPPQRSWRRCDVADWLKTQLAGERRLLIGFDFAFGFPFEPNIGYLGGRARDIDSIFALWSLIEDKSADDTDFGCV